MPSFAISPLLHKNAAEANYAHLLPRIEAEVARNFANQIAGYRDGVVLVPIHLPEIPAQVVRLREGDKIEGAFERRASSEEPRQSIWCVRPAPTSSARVEVVCYRHDVLAENNEQSSEAEWELIAVLAGESSERVPLHPMTFLANHYQLSGGTSTQMDAVTFERELHKSVLFWKDHAVVKVIR